MARKQVLVQLDDSLVAMLDEAARREGVSRSELLRKAAMDLLSQRHRGLLYEQERLAYEKVPYEEQWNDDYAKGLAAEDPEPYSP